MITHEYLYASLLGKVASRAKTEAWAQVHARAAFGDVPISNVLRQLGRYADDYFARYDSRLGDDQILGAAWRQMLSGVRTLLNGELNGLDGGTLDALICEMAKLEGFDPDTI